MIRRKVLIVEDNLMNRKLLHNILHKNYDVIEAVNGQEAMDILKGKYKLISAVVLDVRMPVMDGFQVLEKMRDDAQLSQIPVIIITGSEEEETEVKALSMGANDFVKKPYNPALILHCLRNTINLRETASIVNAIQRDKLTGLYNRETFFDKASEMIQEKPAGYFVMACFDVDNFKIINDQYGANEGDRILRCTGKVISKAVLEAGGISGRISADNFAALYPAVKENEGLADIISENAFTSDYTHANVVYSIGRYIVVDTTLTASSIYDRAYIAKQSVKGRYDVHSAYFDESMREKLIRDQEIISDMDTGLREKQFEVWLQPQFNHVTGALIGSEALVRWRHPEKGMIQPGSFIPIFEQNGFIYELDKYVWEQVCCYIRKWLDEGRAPLPVSVNISRYDLFRADLLDVIKGLIHKYDIPADMLRIEITESAFAESSQLIIKVVEQLIDYGFTIEIDDFGSGYSSLNTLKDVSADVLKLDMRFLESSENSERGGNILEAIVRMAKWINMSVIAEGVETISQANFLKSIGCSYIQGYLYARPMPVDEYEVLAGNIGKEQRLLTMETVENLDNNLFWDPKSMDTLIFNSYVGGAGIYEYHNGKGELLRANDKYVQVIGSTELNFDDILKLNLTEHLDDENRLAIKLAVQRSLETGEEVTDEIIFTGIPGCAHEMYIQVSMRVIASAGSRYLIYCTIENMTAQRQAEKNEMRISVQLKAIMENINGGVTAAVIKDGVPELLFTNEQFYRQFGYTKEQYEKEICNPHELLHPEDKERVIRETKIASETYSPFTTVYRVICRDKSVKWIQNNISIADFPDISYPVQLGVTNDITLLQETDELLRFLNDMAHDLLAQQNSNAGIEMVLWKLLSYFKGNRLYIFEFDYNRRIMQNTYEVCAEGIASEKNNLQEVPFEVASFWLNVFDNQNYINIENVDALEGREDEKQLLQEQGIKSLIAVPLRRNQELIGFIGVDDPKKQQNHVERLDSIGDYIAVMLTRRDLDAKITSDNETLLELMNDIPGGFARMKVNSDDSITPVYLNQGLCKLTGMSSGELMEMYSADVDRRVHPDDVYILNDAKNRMLIHGEAQSSKYRARHGSGEYIWVMIFGRMTKNESGDRFLNIYYTDASEQQRAEEQQKELLDNLPCGAALYALDGDKITIIHLNKRYMELVGRQLRDLSNISVTEPIHPDDRDKIMEEVYAAIREGRDIDYDFRLRHGNEDTYDTYHVVGRIIPKGNDKYAIYATYSQVANETLSYQQMLPVALAAVMGDSAEAAFVKDRNHRYICCSSAFLQLTGIANEEEIIGKTDYDIIDREIADQYRDVEEKIFQSGQQRVNYNEILPSDDGSIQYTTTSKYPLFDGEGNVIGIYCVTRDVTKYRTSFERLRLLTDTIPGGLAAFEINPDGFRIVYFNEGFYKFSGYTREEYINKSSSNPFFWLHEDDMDKTYSVIEGVRNGADEIADCVFRCYRKDGKYRWFSMKGSVSDRYGDSVIINTVQLDITDQKDAEERLRISEEQFRIAAALGDRTVARYDIKTGIYYNDSPLLFEQGFGKEIPDAPQSFVTAGVVEADSINNFLELYQKIREGAQYATTTVSLRIPGGEFSWFKMDATAVFDEDGTTSEAILVFFDVTDQREKEVAYRKWMQSLKDRSPDSYTLFRCNLSKDASFDSVEGSLLQIKFKADIATFNMRTMEYAEKFVHRDDFSMYINTLNSDTLLANYYRGKRMYSLEYREIVSTDEVRWLKVSIQLVEYPDSTDIEAYLMFEDIDREKREELQTKELAETDPLTGVLNRKAFVEKMEQMIESKQDDSFCALMMFDIDGFKLVNDSFGHGVGDRALVDIANSLKNILRQCDLVGRLGGDEFLVCLGNMPGRSVIAKKAKQICNIVRKSFSIEVQMSVSIGVAVCPDDGEDFEALYTKADMALYHVKATGKDNYAFYSEEMNGEAPRIHHDEEIIKEASDSTRHAKRRMLIVEDNESNQSLLAHMFKDDFIIDTADDGNAALIKMRRYGAGLSVVLLDLIMPGMDGFEVLEKMRSSEEMQDIPVIVVSGMDEREAGLRTIKCGASDFITKPVDSDLLRLRVQSAISKAENERLRAQNRYLALQSNEVARYRTVLENDGIVMVEYDFENEGFFYDSCMDCHIGGVYDGRTLWQILVDDQIADGQDVDRLRELVEKVRDDEDGISGSTKLFLKTPSETRHRFCVKVIKREDEFQLGNRMILTFKDMDI